MLNLVYHGTQDEEVYEALSKRMKDRYDIFGSLPDTIDDEWIEDIERLEEMMDRYMHLRRQAWDAFEIRYQDQVDPDAERWELCSRVLARRDTRVHRKAIGKGRRVRTKGTQMAYRNKTFVSFDADNDIHYYRLMRAWTTNDHIQFNFHDAHDLNNLRVGSTELTIKRKLKDRLVNTKVFISLVGEQTRYLYRFVRWEAETALQLGIPIIAVNLNGYRHLDKERCLPILRERLVLHVAFAAAIVQKAIDEWPEGSKASAREGQTGPFYYDAQVYRSLGL